MRRLAIWLVVLTLLLVALPALAGDVNLTWDPAATAASYRVYAGTSSGVYGAPIDSSGATTLNVPNLTDCVMHYAAVTAYNIAGESAYSVELAFWPRPLITLVAPSANPQVVFVDGEGFSTTVSLKLNGNAIPFVRDSCTRLSVNTVDVEGAPDWTFVEVCNAGGASGICSSHVPVKPGTVSGFGAS